MLKRNQRFSSPRTSPFVNNGKIVSSGRKNNKKNKSKSKAAVSPLKDDKVALSLDKKNTVSPTVIDEDTCASAISGIDTDAFRRVYNGFKIVATEEIFLEIEKEILKRQDVFILKPRNYLSLDTCHHYPELMCLSGSRQWKEDLLFY